MPDEVFQMLRYTIEPHISADDKMKAWIWMDRLHSHYTGTSGSCLMADRFKFGTQPMELLETAELA
jgi:hypothetical protein